MSGEVGRDEYLARYEDRWRALDPAQFLAGLDMVLTGLRLQAEG